MEKTEFYKLLGGEDTLAMYIFDHWATDIREKNGLSYSTEDLDFRYEYNYRDKSITVRTQHGDETFPADVIYEKVDKNDEAQMLWHSGYYDGPLSGIARYKGKIVWFDCVDEDYLFRTRQYNLHELSQKQIDDEIYRHNRWRKQGGRHCDYCDDFWDPDAKELKTVSTILNDFYEWFKKNPREKVTDGKIVGSLEYCQFWKERDRWTYREENNPKEKG